MAFAKGTPKPVGSGRKKGSGNLPRLKTALERFAANGYDPLDSLILMAKNRNTKPDLRFRCHAELAPYVYAKMSPEQTGNGLVFQVILQERASPPQLPSGITLNLTEPECQK